jgi:hypothetical protein
MNIEIKTPSNNTIKSLVKLLRTYDRTHNTMVGIRSELHQTLK